MDIPQWLSGLYREGKERGRWNSVEQMTHVLGFASTTTLWRYMNGRRNPDPIQCILLARATGRPEGEVLRMAGHHRVAEMFALA